MQLLQKHWFLATTKCSQTAFTFNCLDTFHELTLQGKTNLYDFYHVLLRRTDNANVSPSIYCYPKMHCTFCLWRNLMAFKCTGQGHDPGGIDATPPGGLMVEYPACPHPGCNLPDDWQSAGFCGAYLLVLLILAITYLHIKLKGKDRKITDVNLAPGLGAFVNETEYQDFLKDYVDQPEHDALVRASIQRTPGYVVTGSGLIVCLCHVMVCRNGAGDLQKGEKYCNMDFIALSAVTGIVLLWIVFTYDIGCQWSKNFASQMEDFPKNMRISNYTQVDIAIPSWHIQGHGPKCQCNFNLAYKKGAGQTCGNKIEGSWSHTNPLAASVCKMGLGTSLQKKFTEAAAMKETHEAAYEQHTATFSVDIIQRWEKKVEKWEDNPCAPNPYAELSLEVTVQDVCLELAKEEAAERSAGHLPNQKVSMMGFLVTGLELEERQ
ncbi:hypothetical protein CVT25_004565 [Psilocybe cyanescens]|uniref:CxC2-like cysteine cluster KDZ transposase-associated domain-containing protein n=1 Tax=Psilocybe cyanescens TaxID=93625 RepID=A0A409W360_PSICY|nr:hypothetical protein CVT25_004565 [Psilocybe cyanescens]